MRTRLIVGALSLSAAALVAGLVREGYVDTAMLPTPYDVPTVGYGTTEGVKIGDKTTPIPALIRAHRDFQKREDALKRCVKVPLHQAEYDLYVDLQYNIGSHGFCTSTIVKRLNAQDYKGACAAILMWKYHRNFDCSTPGNRICGGLWADRQTKHAQCMAVQ